jgi:hypothetical protein
MERINNFYNPHEFSQLFENPKQKGEIERLKCKRSINITYALFLKAFFMIFLSEVDY